MATFYSQGSGNWTTVANWNTNRTGGGSSPASVAAMDNNAFVIQPGHTVTYDVPDSCGWTTGLQGVTVEGAASGDPGVLDLSTASGAYWLPIANSASYSIKGTNTAVKGRFLGGTAETPMPTGAVHLIERLGSTSGTLVDATYLEVALYAAAPVRTSYVLSAAVTTSATVLPVTEDPSAEVEWRAGSQVRVDDWGKQDRETTTATLAASPVGTNQIVLSSAIGFAKNAGALVALTLRNIELRFANAGYGLANGADAIVQCAIRQTGASAQGNGVGYGTGHVVQGSAVISGCTYGVYYSVVTLREGAALTGNTRDVRVTGGAVVGYGVTLASTTQAYEYTGTDRIGADCENTLVLWDNGGVAARYPKFWCAGGSGDTNAVTCPPGHAESCAMLCEDASFDCYLDIQFWAEGGRTVSIAVWMRKTIAGMTSTPSVRILDPCLRPSGTPLAEVVMSDAVDAWELLQVSFAPTVSGPYTMRVRARNATGTVYWAHAVNTVFKRVRKPQLSGGS